MENSPTAPQRILLAVEGMSCAGCVHTVETALTKLPGVASAAVNLATGEAAVVFDPARQTPAQLVEAVQSAGYSAREAAAAAAEPDEQKSERALRRSLGRMALAWALTGPVMAMMILHMTGLMPMRQHDWAEALLEVLLALPVLAIAGAETYVRGVKTAVHLGPSMDTLILLGTAAAFVTGPLSLAGLPVANYAAVGVAKALAESMIRYLAVELAPKGVRINAIAPAIVETDAVRTLFGAQAPDLVRQASSHNPSGRGVTDADYTNLMRWPASPQAEYIQGQVIFVNGGANLSA